MECKEPIAVFSQLIEESLDSVGIIEKLASTMPGLDVICTSMIMVCHRSNV